MSPNRAQGQGAFHAKFLDDEYIFAAETYPHSPVVLFPYLLGVAVLSFAVSIVKAMLHVLLCLCVKIQCCCICMM